MQFGSRWAKCLSVKRLLECQLRTYIWLLKKGLLPSSNPFVFWVADLERQTRSDTDISTGHGYFILYERCVVSCNFVSQITPVGTNH